MTEANYPPLRLMLKPPDAAKALAVSERKLWSLTAPRGPIPCIRLGRSVRYAIDDLRTWIAAQRGDGGRG